ncbi:Indole-3-glycerol phosphate synthase [Crateriforma conspicua]|uniref:Indole-3-glycerol phosphate synthase n=1 Tax=Crateriforma conspicua TaxID=2527996 RepID=A0A5C6FHP2_9PLAN|nr:indole-3-glycerol phosphate synthase TrpC [Crateriforma conspicua]TWU61013.1 Indole-3-glycerol phosphate synthase [Crateriforma conspicua]
MNILETIVARTRETIERDRSKVSESQLRDAIDRQGPCLDFYAALAAGPDVNLIAEVKRASPSAGMIREDFDPVEIARAYQSGGASCLSVLTDEPFFQGSLDYLHQVADVVQLPVLRKDFIVDTYQLLQARAAGASCVLLIAECLDPSQLKDLHDHAAELGMHTLIELFDPENVDSVLDTGTKLVGVNNRDLKTFKTDLHHTLRMRQVIPEDRLLVAESGIRTHDDVQMLGQGGVKAVLVGESLMRQADIRAATEALLGR